MTDDSSTASIFERARDALATLGAGDRREEILRATAPNPLDVSPDAPIGGGKYDEVTDAISFPKDTKAKKSLDAAEDFIKEGEWSDAAHVLQSILLGGSLVALAEFFFSSPWASP